jgi:peptidyl-prolyl cis-trans isomerase D
MQAAQDSLQVYTTQLAKKDTKLGWLHHARDLARWLYHTAKVGQASSAFEIGNHYVVAIVTGETKKGTNRLETVRHQVKSKVMNLEKAKIVGQKLMSMAGLSLDSMAVQYGPEAKVFTVHHLGYGEDMLKEVGSAAKVIPQAVALEAGKRSKAIADETGIVLFDVIARQTPPLPETLQEARKQQLRLEQFRQSYLIPTILEELANTKDYRCKYY